MMIGSKYDDSPHGSHAAVPHSEALSDDAPMPVTKNHYSRFCQVATTVPVEASEHTNFGPNLLTALSMYGRGTPRRISKVFSGLSDEELDVACRELKRFVIQNKPEKPFELLAFRLITGYELLHQANVINIILPTYLALRTPGTPIGKEFVRVMTMEDDNQNPLLLFTLTYTKRRVDKLHGYMMSIFAPEDSLHSELQPEDTEWFGKNREKIIPIWSHILRDGSFTRDRVQALMNNLVPTPRTDKNGVTVIRHMKPQTIPKSRPTLPPVTKTRAIIIDEATRTLTALLETGGTTGVNEKIARKITEVLTGYTDTTLDRIRHNSWTPTTASHFSVGIMNTWGETTANDYMAINTVLAEEQPDGVPAFHYNSWQYCPELHPANNEGDYPEERLNQLLTHYRVIEYMESQDDEPYHWNELTSDYDSYRIEDDQFRQLILTPGPDYNRDDILRIITTHHTYDPDRIKRMLDLGVASITSGVL